MANFKAFTNATTPFEGKKIAIDVDKLRCFFEDVLVADEGKKTTLWSPENTWTVEEDFETVMKIVKE